MEKGLIHIYLGDGKGKTTAAVGLAARFAAYNNNIIFCRFMKTSESGEIESLRRLGVRILSPENSPKGFSWTLSEEELSQVKIACDRLLERATDLCRQSEAGLLILDEVIGAVHKGLAEEKPLLDLLDTKPPLWEIVMTGRNPTGELLKRADYVTKMEKIKHPFDIGVKSRKGIEK